MNKHEHIGMEKRKKTCNMMVWRWTYVVLCVLTFFFDGLMGRNGDIAVDQKKECCPLQKDVPDEVDSVDSKDLFPLIHLESRSPAETVWSEKSLIHKYQVFCFPWTVPFWIILNIGRQGGKNRPQSPTKRWCSMSFMRPNKHLPSTHECNRTPILGICIENIGKQENKNVRANKVDRFVLS
jgi:hypothetical protein